MTDFGVPPPADIRPVEASDLSDVALMLAALADHVRPGFVPHVGVDELARYGPTGLGLFQAMIGRRGADAVGFCLYTYAFSGWRGRPGIFVQDLYVRPGERGTGLGQALLAAVARREASKDCAFIKLDVDRMNEAAIRFYDRLGFAIEGHDHTMVLEGPALAMLVEAR